MLELFSIAEFNKTFLRQLQFVTPLSIFDNFQKRIFGMNFVITTHGTAREKNLVMVINQPIRIMVKTDKDTFFHPSVLEVPLPVLAFY